MKLDFFDKIFGRKEEGEKVKKNLELSELSGWLEEKREERSEKSHKETTPIVKKISSVLFEIKKIAEGMKEKEIPEEIPQRARKIILMSAPMFVQGLIESVNFNYNTDIETFQKNLNLCLDKIGKLLIGKGRYLPIAFSDEIEKIGKKANEILRYRKELRGSIPKDEELENVLNEYEKIRGYIQRLEDMKKTEENLKENIKELKKEKLALEKNLSEMEKSSEFVEFLQREEELEKVNSEIEEIKIRVDNYLSPLQRPLKKFRKFSTESGKSYREIDHYIENPAEEFFSDDNCAIETILKELNAAAISKKLDLKQQEERKVFLVRENFAELRGLRKRYTELVSEGKNKKRELESNEIIRGREDILKKIESVSRNIGTQENELKKVADNGAELKEKILQEKKILEDCIKEIEGKEISIVVNL